MRKLVIVVGALVLTSASLTSASASHPSQMCLDIDPDRHHAVSNDDIVDGIWAYPGATDAGHPPQYEGCVTGREESTQNWEGTEIDLEITGAGDPDSSDSPRHPDLTCTVPNESYQCWVQVPPTAGGEQTIRGWIDLDKDDTTMEGVDLSEGYDEGAEPGAYGEPDMTDVALWTWTHGDPPPDMCGSDDVCWGHVTIDYQARDKRFHGKIERENGSCGTGKVTLRKKRPGHDRKVAEAVISGGRWSVALERKVKGRFYAKLSKTKIETFYSDWPEYPCTGDRSPVLRVP